MTLMALLWASGTGISGAATVLMHLPHVPPQGEDKAESRRSEIRLGREVPQSPKTWISLYSFSFLLKSSVIFGSINSTENRIDLKFSDQRDGTAT